MTSEQYAKIAQRLLRYRSVEGGGDSQNYESGRSGQLETEREETYGTVVVLSKLTGDVPLFAEKFNMPIWFAWCPFNLKDKEALDLLQEQHDGISNVERLAGPLWSSVNMVNPTECKSLSQFGGVVTDAWNAVDMWRFFKSLPIQWPKLDIKLQETGTVPNPISSFAIARFCDSMHFDVTTDRTIFTDFWRKWLVAVPTPVMDGKSEEVGTSKTHLIDHFLDFHTTNKVHKYGSKERKNALERFQQTWKKKYQTLFVDSDGNTSTDAWRALYLTLLNTTEREEYVRRDTYDDLQRILTVGDMDEVLRCTQYGPMFQACGILGWDDNRPITPYRLDNVLKLFVPGVPNAPPLAHTDGCSVMGLVCRHVFDAKENELMQKADAYEAHHLMEWSASKMKAFFRRNATGRDGYKPIKVITDMESDDLAALRILANYYVNIEVYICCPPSGKTSFHDAAIAFLSDGLPKGIKINPEPIRCHRESPNFLQIKPHYDVMKSSSEEYRHLIDNVEEVNSPDILRTVYKGMSQYFL